MLTFKCHVYPLAAMGLAAAVLTSGTLSAQNAQLRVGVRGDSAYIYHTAELPFNYGFHVERSIGGGSFERLTDTLVQALQAPRLLPVKLGARYDAIARSLGADGPSAVFFRLRADRALGLYLSFSYPQVARAMGRLFVDNDAPIGEPVTYRITFVDGLGRPTGQTLERTVNPLTAAPAPAPREVTLTNRGARLRIAWRYPTPPAGRGDHVLRFDVLRLDPATTDYGLVNTEKALLRNEAQQEYFYLFEAPSTGRTETYVVAAVQMTGRRILSEPVEYFVADNVAPPPLQNVRAVTTDSATVEITWPVSTAPDAAGYLLFRARSLTDEFIPLLDEPLDVTENYYHDTTTKSRRVYYYRIASVDSSGNRSLLSTAAMARVRDEAPPPTPANARAVYQNDGRVRLTWEGAVPADLHTYKILYRLPGRNAGGAWARANKDVVQINGFTTSGPEGSGFAEGALYRFGIVATDSSLNHSDTAFVDLKIPDRTPPQPPARVNVTNVGGIRALVKWTRSPSADVTSYVLYRNAEEASGTDSVIARTGENGLKVLDTGVRPGQAYTYMVAAVDSLGNEGQPSESARFVMADYDAPAAPRGLQAVAHAEQGVHLAWQASPGSDIAGYHVYRSDAATGIFSEVSGELLEETSYIDPAGESGEYYRVYAIDTSGNTSRPSAPVRAHLARD